MTEKLAGMARPSTKIVTMPALRETWNYAIMVAIVNGGISRRMKDIQHSNQSLKKSWMENQKIP